MVLSSVLSFARTAAQTDSNGLTDAAGLEFANEALVDFHRRLVDKRVDASSIQEASITGTAGVGVYPYPTNPSTLALKVLELNYGGTKQDDYRVASQVDISNLPNGGFGWLRVNADANSPCFDDRGDRFEIFPTPTSSHNLNAMMRMFYYAKPSVYSSVSDTVNYPENVDAALLGYRIAANYKYSLQGQDNQVTGDQLNLKYQERVGQYTNTLGQGSQQPLQAVPIQITGYEF